MIVSHDRMFLDQVCTKIVETERGVATTYQGNYTQYDIPILLQAPHLPQKPLPVDFLQSLLELLTYL